MKGRESCDILFNDDSRDKAFVFPIRSLYIPKLIAVIIKNIEGFYLGKFSMICYKYNRFGI